MAKIYEDFCQRNCGHLKISERRCYRGECFLKNFFDEVLLKIPQETMVSLSQALHAIRIEEVEEDPLQPTSQRSEGAGKICDSFFQR